MIRKVTNLSANVSTGVSLGQVQRGTAQWHGHGSRELASKPNGNPKPYYSDWTGRHHTLSVLAPLLWNEPG